MKTHYRVVVIGGGVVGASVLYHLAKYGWSDVALVERSVLTAGSSWHAAGGFHALNANPNMAILQAYTIDLLKDVEAESGQSIGMHMTGGIHVASAPERWEWLQSSYRRFQAIGIEDVRLVTPEEIKARCPIINVDGVLGGMWADREGYVDTTGTVWAYAGAAKKRGATVIEHNRVLELKQRPDSSWDLITEEGTVNAEHVVNAGGLWAKQVGRMAGLDLPLSPIEHHYLLTETIPEIAASNTELPMVVDLEGFTYMRQDQKGMLVGIYELNPSTGRSTERPGIMASSFCRRTSIALPASLSSFIAATRSCRPPAFANGSTVPSPSRPTAIRSSARSRTSAATGSPAASWRGFCRAAASGSRSPN